MTGVNTQSTDIDFIWKVHSYTNDYIRFADSKAGVSLAFVGGLLASLFTAKAHRVMSYSRFSSSEPQFWATLEAFTVFAAFASLLAATGLLVSAISPRLWTKARGEPAAATDAQRCPIFWDSVSCWGKSDDYAASVRGLGEGEKFAAIARHVHVLASVARRKYQLIKWGISWGAVGAAFAAATLLARD